MSRRKLNHFAEMKLMPHVFEPEMLHEDLRVAALFEQRGHWPRPLVLELGCGQGNYVLELGARFPNRYFVGIDIKGARMWHGAKAAIERGLGNVFFLRIRAENLERYFEPGEVDEIWLTFSDPHPREGRAGKRLTSPRFLDLYKKILAYGGVIHLKHDNEPFFDYSLEVARENGFKVEKEVRDLYGAGKSGGALLTEIQTTYEQRHVAEGRRIYYARLIFSESC